VTPGPSAGPGLSAGRDGMTVFPVGGWCGCDGGEG
jgi:hypothetical protein